MSVRSTSSDICHPENVADATHAADLDIAAKFGQPLAKPRDLRLEGVGFDLVVESVDGLDQCLAGDDAVASHQERLEDQGLAAPEQDRVAGDGRLVGAD